MDTEVETKIQREVVSVFHHFYDIGSAIRETQEKTSDFEVVFPFQLNKNGDQLSFDPKSAGAIKDETRAMIGALEKTLHKLNGVLEKIENLEKIFPPNVQIPTTTELLMLMQGESSRRMDLDEASTVIDDQEALDSKRDSQMVKDDSESSTESEPAVGVNPETSLRDEPMTACNSNGNVPPLSDVGTFSSNIFQQGAKPALVIPLLYEKSAKRPARSCDNIEGHNEQRAPKMNRIEEPQMWSKNELPQKYTLEQETIRDELETLFKARRLRHDFTQTKLAHEIQALNHGRSSVSQSTVSRLLNTATFPKNQDTVAAVCAWIKKEKQSLQKSNHN